MMKINLKLFLVTLILGVFFTISISAQAPSITTQPETTGVIEGQTATFSVVATGDSLSYQWKKNGGDIAGADTTFYTTPATVIGDNGAVFTCIVSNPQGTDASDNAVLYVTASGSRVTNSQQLLYDFSETSGTVINEVSGVGTAEDIDIMTPEFAHWTPTGLETASGIITRKSTSGSKLINAASTSNEISVEVWIKPEFAPQGGPARIFTFSLSGNFRNFTLEQNGDLYRMRLRTSTTNGNGEPGFSSGSGSATADLTHVVYTRASDGTVKFYINGVENTSGNVSGVLSEFSTSHFLALASEPFGGVYWRGLFY